MQKARIAKILPRLHCFHNYSSCVFSAQQNPRRPLSLPRVVPSRYFTSEHARTRGHLTGSAGARVAPGMILLLLALGVAPRACAQHTPMETAAAQLTDALIHSKQKTVVVFDFSGPDKKVTALGQRLANDSSIALAKSRELRVENRSRIRRNARQIPTHPRSCRIHNPHCSSRKTWERRRSSWANCRSARAIFWASCYERTGWTAGRTAKM
jgi:hypothetical protein